MTTSVSDDDPSHGARAEARGGLAAYLTAYTVTMVGDRFAEIALPIAVLAATGDPAAAGAVAASVQVPALLLALALGDWTDRRSRRAMLVLADAVRAAGFGGFALLAAGPVTQLVPYLVVGTLVGCGNVLFGVAGQAVLPQLVRGTSLGRANALLEVGDAATTVVGPTVAGATIARTSAAWGLVVNAVSYLISGTVLRLFLPPLRPSSALSVARQTGWSPRRLVDPVRLIIRDRLQLSVQLALLVLSAHGAALVLAVVVFGREELALTVGQIGIVLSAAGVGGLASGLLVARFGAIVHRLRTVGLALLLGGAAAGALALTPSFSAAVLANGALDAFVTVGFVATATIRQSRTPNQVSVG